MADPELPDGLRDDLRAAWHRYVDLLAPLRPALHGYCRRLTGNLWDGEDLVQDTLLRAFGTLGSTFSRIDNPRAHAGAYRPTRHAKQHQDHDLCFRLHGDSPPSHELHEQT